MRIGILTYHRSHNFGALFQAIATRTLLAAKGHDVFYIDYWPDYHQAMYALFNWKAFNRGGIRYKYGYLKIFLKSIRYKLPLNIKYKRFIKKNIFPYCESMGKEYDLIIYGSDQIWRKQPWMNTFNPVYFGKHKGHSRVHASYAASMGILCNADEDKMLLKELISQLNFISVREEGLLAIVQNLGFKNVKLSLDPALLLDSSKWDEVFPAKKELFIPNSPYLLYVNYIPESFKEERIREFAECRGLKFVKINGSVIGKDTPDALVTVSPLELFNYIRNASFVFTSSFHALVFSILYKKELFASFARNSSRAKSLLESLGIGEYLLPALSSIPTLSYNIDYSNVHSKLINLRAQSIGYLEEVLNYTENIINKD